MAASKELRGPDRRLLKLLDRLLTEQQLDDRAPRLLFATDGDGTSYPLPSAAQVMRFPCDHHTLQVFLATNPPWDLVVIDVADANLRRDAFLRLTFAAQNRGSVVVARVKDRVTEPEQSVLRLVAAAFDHWPNDPLPKGLNLRALPHLSAAWQKVEREGPHLVMSNQTDARVKLNEDAVDAVFEAQPARGRTLTQRPGMEFTPLGSKRESESPLAGSWRDEYHVPAVSLREYFDVVALPGQVLLQDRVILPDSFRHIARSRLGNRYAPNLGPSFVLGTDDEPRSVLEEPHFYWDSEFRGHFGHLMTEMLSRMWAFDAARERHPDLRIFLAQNKSRGLAGVEVAVLEAFDVTRDDITFVEEPVRVRTMLAATPMFSQPTSVHPEIVGVWDRLSAHLAAQAPDLQRPRRVFIGRRTGKRSCTNDEEVESLFVDRGFEVVFPEELALPEQARLFRDAEVLAGYAGSGLFNAMLATTPKHLVLIVSESYTAENEWMIAAARGHHVDVVWCEAEKPMKKGSFNRSAFHSPFTFNPDREGVFLREVLAQLD